MAAWSGAAAWAAGVSFAFGEIPSGESIGGAGGTLQVDVRNRWPDGSLKFAVISGITSAVDVYLDRGGAVATGADVPEPSVAATVTFSDVRAPSGEQVHSSLVADIATARAAGAGAWSRTQARRVRAITGPVMSEFHYFVPTEHAHLAVWFYVRAWANGTVRVWTRAANAWSRVAAPQTLTYDVVVAVAGSTVLSHDDLVHYHHTVWDREDWVGTAGAMAQDSRHLQDTGFMPRVAVDSVDESVWSARPDGGTKYGAWTRDMAERPVPYARANIDPALGSGGATDNVGPLPQWDVMYGITGDARALWAVLGNAKAGCRFGVHYWDEETGRPIEASRYPQLTATGGGVEDMDGSQWPRTPSPTGPAAQTWYYSHGPKFGYLAYLLTGDWPYLEELQHFAAFGAIWQPCEPRYRSFTSSPNHTPVPWWNQLRANANLLDIIGKAAGLTPERLRDAAVSGPEADQLAERRMHWDVSLQYLYAIYAPDGSYNLTIAGGENHQPQAWRNNVFGAWFQETFDDGVADATHRVEHSQMQQMYMHNAVVWNFLQRVPTPVDGTAAKFAWLAAFAARQPIGLLGASAASPWPDYRMCLYYASAWGVGANPGGGSRGTVQVPFATWAAAWADLLTIPVVGSSPESLPLPSGDTVLRNWKYEGQLTVQQSTALSSYDSHTHAFTWAVALMHELSYRISLPGAGLAADRFYGSSSFAGAVGNAASGFYTWPGAAVVSREWVPLYVPREVGAAALIPMSNTMDSVRQSGMPAGAFYSLYNLGDYSGGVQSPYAGRWGASYYVGFGHAVGNDASCYANRSGWTQGTYFLCAPTPDLQALGLYRNYDSLGHPTTETFRTSYDYYTVAGPDASDPDNPANSAAYSHPDTHEGNPRELPGGTPASCHSYDHPKLLSPRWAGDPHGGMLMPGRFAVANTASRSTSWPHLLKLSTGTWERLINGPMPPWGYWGSVDTRRGRWKPHGGRGYIDLATRSAVEVSGSITGAISSYFDLRHCEYDQHRDIHVYIGNTEADINAGLPLRVSWWPGGDDNGQRRQPTWTNGSAPPMCGVVRPIGPTSRACIFYSRRLKSLVYYTGATPDLYYRWSLPADLADPWTWTAMPITGASRPSQITSPAPAEYIYGRGHENAATKSFDIELLANQSGFPINRKLCIRLVD